MKSFICWLTRGHIWERVGGVAGEEDIWSKLPENQMYMCVRCIKCIVIDVKKSREV
jgi:hypothetical protein